MSDKNLKKSEYFDDKICSQVAYFQQNEGKVMKKEKGVCHCVADVQSCIVFHSEANNKNTKIKNDNFFSIRLSAETPSETIDGQGRSHWLFVPGQPWAIKGPYGTVVTIDELQWSLSLR